MSVTITLTIFYKITLQQPNELFVAIRKGRDLLACDTAFYQSGNSDPLVKLKINGVSKKTKYIPNTLNPTWDEVFVFPAIIDISLSLELTCYDYDGPMKSDLIGKCIIPIRNFRDKKPHSQWYKLGDKYGEVCSDMNSLGC